MQQIACSPSRFREHIDMFDCEIAFDKEKNLD